MSVKIKFSMSCGKCGEKLGIEMYPDNIHIRSVSNCNKCWRPDLGPPDSRKPKYACGTAILADGEEWTKKDQINAEYERLGRMVKSKEKKLTEAYELWQSATVNYRETFLSLMEFKKENGEHIGEL